MKILYADVLNKFLVKTVSGKTEELLSKIEEGIAKLNDNMTRFMSMNPETRLPTLMLAGVDLLSLPDHLRKTIMTLFKKGIATADEVAADTHRARAVESAYLNQLATMGYLHKERVGRKTYFRKAPDLGAGKK